MDLVDYFSGKLQSPKQTQKELRAKHLTCCQRPPPHCTLAAARSRTSTSQTVFPWNQWEIRENVLSNRSTDNRLVFFLERGRCASFTQRTQRAAAAVRGPGGGTGFWHRPLFVSLRLLLYWPLMKLRLSAADNSARLGEGAGFFILQPPDKQVSSTNWCLCIRTLQENRSEESVFSAESFSATFQEVWEWFGIQITDSSADESLFLFNFKIHLLHLCLKVQSCIFFTRWWPCDKTEKSWNGYKMELEDVWEEDMK